jgi:DNA modification methylase
VNYEVAQGIGLNRIKEVRNHHPTVKPLALMEWLVRLVTPPGGHVVDPFAGSATTLCAAVRQGFQATGSELDADYIRIGRARIAYHSQPLDASGQPRPERRLADFFPSDVNP